MMPETAENGINSRQKRAIAALLAEKTIGAAARSAGVGERTLYTWLAQPDFVTALKNAESQMINAAVRRLLTGVDAALDTLQDLMINAESETVKRAAATDWLNLLLKVREIADLERRIAELERRAE